MNTPPPHFFVYWRQADWGFYARRNEAFARNLAGREGVGNVTHLETVSLKGVLATAVRALTVRDPQLRRVYRLHLGKALSPRPITVADGLAVKSLVILRFGGGALTDRVNRLLIRRQVARLRAGLPSVLLAYPPAPYQHDVVEALRPTVLLADLVDDVPALEVDPGRRAAREREFVSLLPRCRAVFATSPRIVERYAEHAPAGIRFLPNGVATAAEPEAGAGDNGDRPRVAYTGMINRSLDFDVLTYLLACYPGVDFLLIGPVEADTRARRDALARTFGNCHYLGPRQHDEMRRLIAGCDVLLNLKRADRLTRGNDAIKIYEYLATGRPVVSTPMAPADRLHDLIGVATEPAEFERALGSALIDDDPHTRERRLAVAADNSWSRRVDVVLAGLAPTGTSLEREHEHVRPGREQAV